MNIEKKDNWKQKVNMWATDKIKVYEEWHLIIGKESNIARMGDCKNLPVSKQRRPWLEQPEIIVFII